VETVLAAGGENPCRHPRQRRPDAYRPHLRKDSERDALGDRVRRIIRHCDLVGVGTEMIERVDDNGRWLLEVGQRRRVR